MDDRGTSRRTVLSAAWALPVVAVAVGTPLASASGARPTLTLSMTFSDPWTRFEVTTKNALGIGVAAPIVLEYSLDGVGWSRLSPDSTSHLGSVALLTLIRGIRRGRVSASIDGVPLVALASLPTP
ncbi:MAG: hypothetical protein Q7T71_19130 [Herbiconiux sp.]|nr:hypothetical protein [Herbiconiux sp.]